MKLWDIVAYKISENPIDFGENSVKVKVMAAKNTKYGFWTITYALYSKSFYPNQKKHWDMVIYQIDENPID